MYRKFKNVVFGLLAHGTPSIVFSRILRSETLVYNSYFFQSSRFTAIIRCYVSVKLKLQHGPPGHTPGIWHLCRPGEEGIWLSESSRGWGIWSPCFRGGGLELHPRFHVKSLAWRAIMGDAVLEDFRGKDCAFVASWLRGKGLNKLCAVFEVLKC